MKKSILSIIDLGTLVTLLTLLVLPLNSCLAGDAITNQMLQNISGVNLPNAGQNPSASATEGKILGAVGNIIQAFLSLFGIIFMILIIFGGYKWMMAAGREEEVKKAKDIIRAAVIGLVIVVMAYSISYFVASNIQGSIE